MTLTAWMKNIWADWFRSSVACRLHSAQRKSAASSQPLIHFVHNGHPAAPVVVGEDNEAVPGVEISPDVSAVSGPTARMKHDPAHDSVAGNSPPKSIRISRAIVESHTSECFFEGGL